MLTGGCHCGAIRYAAWGRPFAANICHCDICRGTSGAPCLAWFSVRPSELHWMSGEPVRYASSPDVVRSFCGRCGTQLTFLAARYGEDRIDVTTGSLDDPERCAPEEEIWIHRKLGWMHRLGDLPDDDHRWPAGDPP